MTVPLKPCGDTASHVEHVYLAERKSVDVYIAQCRGSESVETVTPEEVDAALQTSPMPDDVWTILWEKTKAMPPERPWGTGSEGDVRRAKLWSSKVDHGDESWRDQLAYEVCQAMAEVDPFILRERLTDVAAKAILWVEAIDRKAGIVE